MASHRTLELTLISAKDLKDVNFLSKMEVYAVATISGDHRTQQRTPVDRVGGKNPSWNSTLRFSVPAEPSAASRLVIDILIRSEHTFGDRDVGEVHIPVKELLQGIKPGSNFVSYQVRKPHSSKPRGVLNLSYRFSDLPAAPAAPFQASIPANSQAVYPPQEKPAKGNEPVMAYPPAGASGSGYPPSYPPAGGYPMYPPPQAPQGGYQAYPPPQAWSGYGAPPPAGYGYGAPPANGYGYGAAVPPRKKKNNLGLGLGAGLIGGALGGMLIGDMISDEGAYDAGYDAGFDNGFDF